MPMGRPKAELVLQSAEQAQLQSMVRARSIPAALRARAQIVLASAGGEANSSIAARLGYTNAHCRQMASPVYRAPDHGFVR